MSLSTREMRLDAVQAVKGDARSLLDELGGAEGSSWARVSLGIAPGGTPEGHRLAVRFRSPERMPAWEESVVQRLRTKLDLPPSALDVRFTGPVTAVPLLSESKHGNPVLTIGSSVSHYATDGGTLGFFARANEGGAPGFVSTNHVIGRLDEAIVDDPIVHPGGWRSSPAIGTFVRSAPLRAGGGKTVDAAFALLTDAVPFDPGILPGGRRLRDELARPEGDLNVAKYSTEWGETFGRVTGFDFDTFKVLSYGATLVSVKFERQIEVESSDRGVRFSDVGDCGALVYNAACQPLGLLFAQTEQGGAFERGLTYLNPMPLVLSTLGITLLT